jgi:YVTN family beta-propeller protein
VLPRLKFETRLPPHFQTEGSKMPRIVSSCCFALVLLASGSVSALAQSVDQPLRSVTDPGTITTRQAISPAGVQTVFKGRVQGVQFGKAGELFVITRTHLYRLDWLENRVISRHELGRAGVAGLRGLAYDRKTDQGVVAYVEGAASPEKGRVRLAELGAAPAPGAGGLRAIGAPLGRNNVGEVSLAGGKAIVPLMFDNRLAIIDRATGARTEVNIGIAPFASLVADGLAYVSNWGGDKPVAGQASAPTGLEADADLVRIDAKGVAMAGTVSIVDLKSSKLVGTVPTGRHPTGMALNRKTGLLYVTNANDDSISVIDTRTRQVQTTLALKPFDQAIKGIAPNSLVVDQERQRLYVTCGGINAVIVYDLASERILGMIPTGWYPASIALDEGGKSIVVGTLLGVGSGQNEGANKRFVHANRGTVHVIALPDDAQLASYSAAVSENNRMAFASAQAPKPDLSAPPKAVPSRAGEPSLIEHVVYIIKENRTYDQLFGDLPRGKGEPSFVLYGADVTPNQRKLAMEFGLLDNFFSTGGNSANGHQWVTQANEASYTLWPGYSGRSYPFDGTDPLAYASTGFIWDAALAQKKSVAVFGEFAPRVGDLSDVPPMARADLMSRWQAGETFSKTWNTRSPIPPLDSVLVRNFPGYSTNIPDVIRSAIFIEQLKTYETNGSMPNLTIIQLPSDHTNGTSPKTHTPKAMVADNDFALGQIVEALTKSPFWPKMAIFVVEDDSQNGVDHVDGHRTIALTISPYSKRGSVDSTFYSHQSMLKTIEQILGLPTLSMFDLIANDMRASFQDTPDLRGFTAIRPQQSLQELNQDPAGLAQNQRRDALKSAAMRWDVPDAVPSATLNRILWHKEKGHSVPYPKVNKAVFSPFQLDLEDQEEAEDE